MWPIAFQLTKCLYLRHSSQQSVYWVPRTVLSVAHASLHLTHTTTLGGGFCNHHHFTDEHVKCLNDWGTYPIKLHNWVLNVDCPFWIQDHPGTARATSCNVLICVCLLHTELLWLWRFFSKSGIATLLNSNNHYLMKSSANHEFLPPVPSVL